MDANRELERLARDPQLIVSIEFVGRVYQAYIGDLRHGYRRSRRWRSFRDAVQGLRDEARKLYPQSQYVKELPAG